jgi:hypothetical protein
MRLAFYLDSNQLLATGFENNARQRARRGTLQDGAVFDREEAVMARALQPILRLQDADELAKWRTAPGNR